MKKILCLIVACMLVSVLASAEDDPVEPAFGARKLAGRDYTTEGVLKKKGFLGEYLGHSPSRGVCTEVDGDILCGSLLVSEAPIWYFLGVTQYACARLLDDYTWEGGTINKATDTDASMVCWDPINDPDILNPFIDQSDCTAKFKFGDDPTTFNSTITCVHSSTGDQWKLKETGVQKGQFTLGTSSSRLNQLGDIESLFDKLRK